MRKLHELIGRQRHHVCFEEERIRDSDDLDGIMRILDVDPHLPAKRCCPFAALNEASGIELIVDASRRIPGAVDDNGKDLGDIFATVELKARNGARAVRDGAAQGRRASCEAT